MSHPKNEKIDIFIPAIEKDLNTLPHVIDAIRKFVKHPIGKIMIVAPPSPRIISLCNQKKCTFINENFVLPIKKSDIDYKSAKWERSGWLFQQLLKLNCDKFASQQFILVIDADTVFIRPHVFRKKKKTVYFCRYWSHQEYFRAYKRLLGKKAKSPHSFVTHYMLFEKSKLARFKKKIESKQKRKWYSAIIKCTNKASKVGFSEFESYGNFIYSKYPGSFVIKKASNKSLYTNASSVSSSQREEFAKRFRSLSFHKRSAYNR
ncbi:DUF6492 family protein [Brevibacillus sp. SYSU BS000544]|uniref:DUF6492 family protein n=1 Tax=Brevibacillus sp. SYSU BS000544 TaxID=3416443 RepID=UPI003CE58991